MKMTTKVVRLACPILPLLIAWKFRSFPLQGISMAAATISTEAEEAATMRINKLQQKMKENRFGLVLNKVCACVGIYSRFLLCWPCFCFYPLYFLFLLFLIC